MNYGYAPEDFNLALEEADERDRQWIQLYAHVAGAVDLRGCTLLEVGSGRGGGASFMKRYLGPARVTGLDLSPNAVTFSRTMHRVDGLVFEAGDAEHLPFADDCFDAVVNIESSHCYPSLERFVSEVRRVLRPSGYFLYADFRDRENQEAWRIALQGSGLRLLRETDITGNVVAALELDNDRKLELIDRLIPRILRRSFLGFAAVRGSALFEAFRSRQMTYRSFVLQKSAGA
jgi:SAM-dependent methyltransferase